MSSNQSIYPALTPGGAHTGEAPPKGISLALRLDAIFLLMAVITVAMVAMTWWIADEYERNTRNVHQEMVRSAVNLAQANAAFWKMRTVLAEFAAGDTAQSLQGLRLQHENIRRETEIKLDMYAKTLHLPTDRQTLADLRAQFERFADAGLKLLDLYEAGRPQQARRWEALTTVPYGAATARSFERLLDAQIAHAADHAETQKAQWRTTRILLALLAASLFALLGLAYWIGKRALARVRGLLSEAWRTMREQFGEKHAEPGGGDEIRSLGDRLNAMSDKFAARTAELVETETLLRNEHDNLEKEVSSRTQALESANRELTQRHRQGELLTELTGLLQTVRDTEEAAVVLPRFIEPLLAPHAGSLYLIKSSMNYMDLVARWGEGAFAPTFEPSTCWALRRGQPYTVENVAGALQCGHVDREQETRRTMCVPMIAQGQTLGLLHVAFADNSCGAEEMEACEQYTRRIGEHLALALSNLKLREELREQSIRDPLTGLHNRRFLEESLRRELARSERLGQSFAVFMLDVDFFKRFNDQHGHEAGDAVLRGLGRLLRDMVRAGDLACRFGGEEFTLVLSSVDLSQACLWAEKLLRAVRRLEVKSGVQTLPPVTVSLGLALYPDHGNDTDTLLQAADFALYEAKHQGRDRLVVSGAEPSISKSLEPY